MVLFFSTSFGLSVVIQFLICFFYEFFGWRWWLNISNCFFYHWLVLKDWFLSNHGIIGDWFFIEALWLWDSMINFVLGTRIAIVIVGHHNKISHSSSFFFLFLFSLPFIIWFCYDYWLCFNLSGKGKKLNMLVLFFSTSCTFVVIQCLICFFMIFSIEGDG